MATLGERMHRASCTISRANNARRSTGQPTGNWPTTVHQMLIERRRHTYSKYELRAQAAMAKTAEAEGTVSIRLVTPTATGVHQFSVDHASMPFQGSPIMIPTLAVSRIVQDAKFIADSDGKAFLSVITD